MKDNGAPDGPGSTSLRSTKPEVSALKGNDPSREETMFLDADGYMICLGDVVRAMLTINQHVHGDWADYRIRKAPGGYLLSYLRSEKGQVLPEGYTGGFMADCLPDEDERDLKTLVFATVPVPVSGWRIVSESGYPKGVAGTASLATARPGGDRP